MVEFDGAGFDCADVVMTAQASAAVINTARVQVIGLTCLPSDETMHKIRERLNVQSRNFKAQPFFRSR